MSKTLLKIAERADLPKMITQADMREFHKLEKQFMDVKARYLAMSGRYVMLLKGGVRQEAGKFRLVRKERTIRRVSWKEQFIEVRGVKAAEAVLRNAKRKTYYSLSFEGLINE